MVHASHVRLMQLIVLSALLLAPAVLFLIRGSVGKFENRPQTNFPDLREVIEPASSGREALADAIFERSFVKREAIRWRNAAFLHTFGFADTDLAVSGAPDWFFYKPAFGNWDCRHHARLEDKLDRFITIAEVAEAAEARILFASTPNKASVEKQAVKGRAALYSNCYEAFEAVYRSTIRDSGVRRIIDHAEALRSAPEEPRRYLRTDTHWTAHGGGLALRQLVAEAPFDLDPAPLQFHWSGDQTVQGDITDGMLLLARDESFPTMQPIFKENAGSAAMQGARMLFVHDSFYGRILDLIRAYFPDAELLSLNHRKVEDTDLSKFDTIVIQSIERSLLGRYDSIHGWKSPVGEWILDRSENAANACDWSSAMDLLGGAEREAANASRPDINIDGHWVIGDRDPKIYIDIPTETYARSYCLEVTVHMERPGRLQLFVPPLAEADGRQNFAEMRSVERFVEAGEHRWRLVLPARTKGNLVRFDPSDGPGATVTSLRRAALPRLRAEAALGPKP